MKSKTQQDRGSVHSIGENTMNRISAKFGTFAVCLFTLLLLVGGFTQQTVAQTVTSGDITGTVSDASGAVVVGAEVSLTSIAEGTTQTTTTNSSGLYRFSFLKNGDYKMSVAAKGFKSSSENVTVGVGQVLSANFKLELGAASEVVEVTGAAPLIQTENGDTSTTYDEIQLRALPAPGGDITSYAYTAPGVVVSNGAGYGNFSSNGLPSTSNLFTVNGNDYMDPYLNLNNSGASNLTLGSNELSEVTVVENGYTADYGRQAAAQLNAATKSGTNSFHGNATYGYNGTALNADDWFTNANPDPTLRVRPHAVNNTYAVSAGGPIVKNKLFFFADYEALRMILPGVSGTNIIPTPAFGTYVLSQVPAAALPFYQSIFSLYAGAPGSSGATPVPGGGCGDFDGTAGFGAAGLPCAQQFNSAATNKITEWILATSVDYDINPRDHLKVRYQMDRGVQATGTDPINSVFNATSVQPEYNGQLTETHTFNGTTVNNIIISGAWYKALFGPPNFAQAVATFPTTLAFGGTAEPFTALGGADNAYPQGRIVTQAQLRDNFSKVIGGHDIKIGADYRRNIVSDYSALANTSGALNINTMTEFVQGATFPISSTPTATNCQVQSNPDLFGPCSFYNANFTNLGAVKIKLYNVGVYLQDQWKITSKLNLTLGIRVDRTANPSCATNCFTRLNGPFEDITHDANVPYNATIQGGLKYAFPDVEKAVFSPRFGFAYSVTSNTVIRGGFGIFDDEFPALAVDRSVTNAPAVSNFSSNVLNGNESLAPGAGSVYADAAAANAAFTGGFSSGATLAGLQAIDPGFAGFNYFAGEPKLLNPKFAEWNVEIQRQLGSRYSVGVNYAGNHGYDLMTVNTWLNAFCVACAPGQTFGGAIGTTPTDTRFQEISNLTNNGFANYHGVTASFKMKPNHGFSGQANYTYSHGLDTCSNNCLEPFVANTLVSLRYQASPGLPGASYGNSDYDVRHNFNLNYVYQTPSHWSSSLMNRVVGGWTIGGVLYYHTGLPWSPVDSAKRNSDLANITGLRTTTPLATFNGGKVVSHSCGKAAAQAGAGIGGAACSDIGEFTVGSLDFGNARNALRGPGFFNTDLSLLKNFKIGERLGFAVGATAFDILNHQNFDLPINSIRSPAYGQIFSTIGTNTNPYGAFFGVPLNGRILQVNAKITF
jgi:Carboxypeptidase regulatory-like domain/TonB dependent receptor